MKKFILLFFIFSSLSNFAQELPSIDFKEARGMDDAAKTFFQRLVRYTCNGGISYAKTKNFIPKIYDYSLIPGSRTTYSFRLAFDRADNHAEIELYKKATGELSAFIPRDTRDGLCILGKFSIRDIEAYERNLE